MDKLRINFGYFSLRQLLQQITGGPNFYAYNPQLLKNINLFQMLEQNPFGRRFGMFSGTGA